MNSHSEVALALIFQNIHNEASSRSPAAGQRQVGLAIFGTSVNKSFSEEPSPEFCLTHCQQYRN